MKKRFWAGILALIALLVPLTSCKKGSNEGGETKETIELDTSDGYDYGKLDCQNGDFTFLQCDEDRWNMKTVLAPEADAQGDDISDAVYSRNAKIATIYNVNIKCINRDIYETGDFVRTQAMGGETAVDAAFVIGSSVAALISEGLLNDISAMNDVQIYEPWWGQGLREDSQFGGASTLYYAQSDISLTAFDLTWCVAVNMDRITALDMENPYELVENKQWTIEKLLAMSKEGMSPNVDGTYTYTEGTDCIFGFTTYNNFTLAALNGAGCFLTRKNDIGLPAFTGEGERFLDVVERYATAFHSDGMTAIANDEGFHYEEMFADGRALFAGVEVKALTKFRALEMHYGVIPVPLYDVNQERYYSTVNYLAPLLVIPNTNTDGNKTGRILDTMAYLSYKDVLPVYYVNNLSLKAVKDPESSKMLDIIRDTRCFETSLLYGWTEDFYLEVRDVLAGYVPNTSATSAIRKYRDTIIGKLDAFAAGLQ